MPVGMLPGYASVNLQQKQAPEENTSSLPALLLEKYLRSRMSNHLMQHPIATYYPFKAAAIVEPMVAGVCTT